MKYNALVRVSIK